MAEHTPGPWILELEYNPKGFQKILGGQWGTHNIAQVVKRQSMKDEDEANARLIAASPDLLAAAKAALDRLCDPYLGEDDGERQRPEIAALEQAIAKAEGPSGGYARLLDTDPKFESFVRGYIDKAEGRA